MLFEYLERISKICIKFYKLRRKPWKKQMNFPLTGLPQIIPLCNFFSFLLFCISFRDILELSGKKKIILFSFVYIYTINKIPCSHLCKHLMKYFYFSLNVVTKVL